MRRGFFLRPSVFPIPLEGPIGSSIVAVSIGRKLSDILSFKVFEKNLQNGTQLLLSAYRHTATVSEKLIFQKNDLFSALKSNCFEFREMELLLLLRLFTLCLLLSAQWVDGICPFQCSGHGTCVGAFCECLTGYTGVICSESMPPFS